VKRGKRIDAELLFHGEYGVELQLAHEGVRAVATRGRIRGMAQDDEGKPWYAPGHANSHPLWLGLYTAAS